MTLSTARDRGLRARLRRGIRGGVFATLTMDGAMLAAEIVGRDAFSSPRLSPGMIGRWAGDLAAGRWRGEDMLRRSHRRGEDILGMATHYATGIALTAAFLAIRGDRRRSAAEATAYGIATSVLPLLVMFPSMGYGCFGVRSGEAARLNRTMVLGHVAFGLGIAISTRRSGR